MKHFLIPVLVIVLFLSSGCASVGTYFKDRALDFADIYRAKAGYGGPVSASVSVLGVAHGSTGFSLEYLYGITGREYESDYVITVGVPVVNFGFPLLGIHDWEWGLYHEYSRELVFLGPISTGFRFYEGQSGGDKFGHFGVLGLNSCLLSDKLSVKEKDKRLCIRSFDLSFHVTAGVALECGISLIELGDFLLGWTTFDFAEDDTKARKKKKEEEKNTEPGEEEK